MMNIEKIVGDVVLLVLDNHEPLKELGITQKGIYTKIVGYDENGIWIEHPQFAVPIMNAPENSKTKKPKTKMVTASVLIAWAFIVSVVHFPDVEGFDFPSPFETHIGFDIDE